MRTPPIDVDVISSGDWEIREVGVLTMLKGGWFTIENGLYSEEYGEEAFNIFYDEFRLSLTQDLNEDYDSRIVLLTEEKLVFIDEEGAVSQCDRADRTDLRLDFNIVYLD